MKNVDAIRSFDGRAGDYASARPGYAPALLEHLRDEFGISDSAVVADIGAGTGKLSVQLLARGMSVVAVEPNEEMRAVADATLGGNSQFVVTAQAFHWLDVPEFAVECARITKPDGLAVLIWNVRDGRDPLVSAWSDVFRRVCTDFRGFSNEMAPHDRRISDFFGGAYVRVEQDHDLTFDRDSFLRRSLSSSYSLREGSEAFDEYVRSLDTVFDRYAVDGVVTVRNASVAYVGSVLER